MSALCMVHIFQCPAGSQEQSSRQSRGIARLTYRHKPNKAGRSNFRPNRTDSVSLKEILYKKKVSESIRDLSYFRERFFFLIPSVSKRYIYEIFVK